MVTFKTVGPMPWTSSLSFPSIEIYINVCQGIRMTKMATENQACASIRMKDVNKLGVTFIQPKLVVYKPEGWPWKIVIKFLKR